MSQRAERVARLVQQALSEILARGEVRDPRLAAATMISVTAVRVSPDLRQARVGVSIVGEPDAQRSALAGLRRAAPFLAHAVARRIAVRAGPRLEFFHDRSIEHAARVGAILREVGLDGSPAPPDEDVVPGEDAEPDEEPEGGGEPGAPRGEPG